MHRVEQRLAFFQAGSLRLQVHGVRAKPSGRCTEADARARGILKKRQRHRFSAQRGQLFERMPLDFLEGLALIEEKSQFVRGKRFEGEEIAEAVRHIFTLDLAPFAPELSSEAIR